MDGVETSREFVYDLNLIGPGNVVYLGGSDNSTAHVHRQQFRGIITKACNHTTRFTA